MYAYEVLAKTTSISSSPAVQAEADQLLHQAACHLTPRIGSLPLELATNVSSHLGVGDLLPLARVNRCLAEVILPRLRRLLYGHVCLTVVLPLDRGQPHDRIPMFLRTLLRHPELALMVSGLEVIVWTGSCIQNPLRLTRLASNVLSEHDMELARPVVMASLQTGPVCLGRLRGGHIDALIAAVLACTKNIETLILPTILQTKCSALGPALKAHAPSLTRLNNVGLDNRTEQFCSGFYRHTSYDFFLPLFSVPNLRSVRVRLLPMHANSEGVFSRPGPPIPPAARLTSLTVSGDAPERVLGQILALCPSLEDLSYEYIFSEARNRHMASDALGRALRLRGSTLESVKIVVGSLVGAEYEGIGGTSRNMVGSLACMSRLRGLDMTVATLAGHRSQAAPPLAALLPGTLRTLRLRLRCCSSASRLGWLWDWTGPGLARYVCRFLSAKGSDGGSAVPSGLEKIELLFEGGLDEDDDDDNNEMTNEDAQVMLRRCGFEEVSVRDRDETWVYRLDLTKAPEGESAR